MNASNAEKIRLLRQGTGIGLREAYDLIVRCNGDLEAAKAKVAARSDRGVYISPEQGCRAAIEEYYAALDRRADGVVAMSKAFRKIEDALGMSWKQGASFEYMPEPGHITKWNRGPNYDVIYLKADEALKRDLAAEGSNAWIYTPAKGPRAGIPEQSSYWSLPEAALDDPDAACAWGQRAIAAAVALRAPKPKKPRN